jgi:hypothetical protein
MKISDKLLKIQQNLSHLYSPANTEVYTKISLVNEMLNKWPKEVWNNPNLKWLDSAVKSGIYLSEILIRLMQGLSEFQPNEKKRYIYIIENMLYGYTTSDLAFGVVSKLLMLKDTNHHIKNSSFLEENITMKFDINVMNPPYFNCLKFLNKALKTSTIIMPILPARFILNQKDSRRNILNDEILDCLETHVSFIKLLNGNKYFSGVGFTAPLCILNINMNKIFNVINVEDEISNKEYKVKSLDELTQYSYYEGYKTLKSKVLNFCNDNDNMFNHQNKNDNKWYVNIAKIRGHVNHKNENIHSYDYYTFVPRDIKPQKNISKGIYFSFTTKIEAENFIEYLKTDFTRFALSILKTDMHIDRKELKSVPWLDFTKKYTDVDLYKMFNITEDEIKFIKSIIPKYYEN